MASDHPGSGSAAPSGKPEPSAAACAQPDWIHHYLIPGWAGDYVIVELWHQGRWRQADPDLGPEFAFNVHDIPAGDGAPFETAAEAWLAWRAGVGDLSAYGVEPNSAALSGPDLVRDYVIFEVAHRYGDEMLLWDGWGASEQTPEIGVIDS